MRITIDGNIGAGKTTVLKLLKEHGHAIDLEPVEKWETDLKKIYQEGASPYVFQKIVYADRAENAPMHPLLPWIPFAPETPAVTESHLFVERSPYFTKHVFLPAIEDKLSPSENAELQVMYQKTWVPDRMIYLQSSPEMCMQKIAKRGRSSELDMDPMYIQRLHFLHEKAAAMSNGNVTVIQVDGKTPEEVTEMVLMSCMKRK